MAELISHISVYSILIPLITGLVLFLHLNATARIMLMLLFFATIPQLATLYFKDTNTVTLIYNLYLPFEILIISFLFYHEFKKGARLILIVQLIIFMFFYLHYIMDVGLSKLFFSELVCLNNLFQISWVSIYFYQIYKSDELFEIERSPMFWFCMAILIYAPCTYFLFAFRSYILNSKVLQSLWEVHGILNTIYYLIICVGFIVPQKKSLKWKTSTFY